MDEINWNFDNTYFGLSDTFKENINPVPVKNPELILLNHELASELNLDFSRIENKKLSKILPMYNFIDYLLSLVPYLRNLIGSFLITKVKK